MPAFPFALPPKQSNGLIYTAYGINTMPAVQFPRAPKPSDVNYPLFTLWRNSNENAVLPDHLGDMWYLAYAFFSGANQQAKWLKLSGGGSGSLTTLTGNDGVLVTPDGAGNITLFGLTTTNSTYPAPVYVTSTSPHIEDINVQVSAAIAASDVTKVGLAAFKSTEFNVDAAGFVSLVGGSTPAIQGIIPDAHTAPGTSPILPDSSGNITIEGGATFATGTQAKPIRVNSLAASTGDLQIQLAGSNAGSATANNFGVSQFDANQFNVTSGFVQLVGGTTPAFTQITRQVFNTAGTFTYTPTTGMQFCDITVIGSGGGGGGCGANSGSTTSAGAGGGGGGWAKGIFSAATIGASQSVTIGAGGAGGVTGANSGANGNSSSVGILISATGGIGGTAGTPNNQFTLQGGSPGIGTGGDVQGTGSNGGWSQGQASALAFTWGGAGGGSLLGGFGNVAAGGANGNNGLTYGCGGGGGASFVSAGAFAGGNGNNGIVIITEFI